RTQLPSRGAQPVEIVEHAPTGGTAADVRPDRRLIFGGQAAVDEQAEPGLDVFTRAHYVRPCVPVGASARRNRRRALCNCDFDVPSEIPTSDAISLCSSPSTSCSTKTVRHPGGNVASARSRSSRSTT